MTLEIPHPSRLGLKRTLEFSAAPEGKTFYYAKRRNEAHGGHLQVIVSNWEDRVRFRETPGPFIYMVTGGDENVRYIGKSWEKFLYRRWLRPQPYIHHRESRDHIVKELREGRGPLHLWSASAAEMRVMLPTWGALPDERLIAGLEALWLSRWGSGVWNSREERLEAGFFDLEYWKAPART